MGITRRWNSIFGFLFGIFLSWIFFGGIDKNEIEKEYYGEGIQLAENWERNILEQKRGEENGGGHNQQQPKLNRPRFASSELGIQQKLLIFILSRTSTSNIISPLYQFLSQQNNNILPIKVFIFTTTDQQQQQLINSNNDLPLNAQTIIVRRSDPVSLLNSIANISLLTPANWYLILPDTTFVNIYELEKIINSILWNSPIAFGWNINEINNNNNEELNNNNENEGHCILEAGLLLSSTAMNLIIQGRHLCNGLSLTSFSSSGHGEDYSLEICIRLASNINCKSTFEGFKHNWWRISSKEQESLSPSIHDQIEHLSQFSLFNNSLTISPLLSELDISALIKHFLNVKFTKIEEEIKLLEEKTLKYYSIEETGWPIGVNNLIKPINRFQVPVWELVTSEWKRFSNDPEENWANLNEDERIEWKQVYEEAKMSSKCSKFETTFIEGYKRFNPNRGIDYLIDLNCNNNNILERIQINRPIHSTKLLEKVPYVKEDREIALLVPVETPAQIYGLHPFLRKILSICMSGIIENSSNQIRLLIAVRNIEALPIRLLSENLAEMRKRCHLMESSLLLLKPDPNYQIAIELAALDEAVDRFGQQTLFLLLSPFTDFQPDFLDRVRLNSIQNFQVFFPIPFTEFNQIVTGLTPKELQTFIIHKDRGRFASDIDYWPIAGLFGSDFISSRIQHPNAQTIYSLFLNQTNIHIFRAIEPSLKIRSHLHDCSSSLTKFFSIEQKKNCERRRKLSLGTRAQLAKLFLFTIAPSNNNEFQKPK